MDEAELGLLGLAQETDFGKLPFSFTEVANNVEPGSRSASEGSGHKNCMWAALVGVRVRDFASLQQREADLLDLAASG